EVLNELFALFPEWFTVMTLLAGVSLVGLAVEDIVEILRRAGQLPPEVEFVVGREALGEQFTTSRQVWRPAHPSVTAAVQQVLTEAELHTDLAVGNLYR